MERRILAFAAVGLVVLSAGCGFLLGLNSLTFSATPINVSDQAVEETGYEETAAGPRTEQRNYSAFGQTRTVEVTNYMAKYERRIQLGPLGSQRAGVFATLASPEIEIAGNTLNPLQSVQDEEILSRVGSQYEGVSVGEQTGTRTIESLGDSRTLTRFNGSATLAGSEVPVYLETSRFKHGNDFIVVVAIYPQDAEGEADRVATLMRDLQHTNTTATTESG